MGSAQLVDSVKCQIVGSQFSWNHVIVCFQPSSNAMSGSYLRSARAADMSKYLNNGTAE